LKGKWVPHDTRDEVVDFVNRWSSRTEIAACRMVRGLGIASSKFYDWRKRYGQVNEHNARVPRDHWLQWWETRAILNFECQYPLEGYRRLAFMMLDRDIVAVSPSSVYRVLKKAGRIQGWNRKPSRKGTGFDQPLQPHEHWHIDVSYINVSGTFYYLCSLLDGYSRYIVHWEIRETMKEVEIEIILQRAREQCPDARPRIISDNGPQFIAKDFKTFIRICGMTHVRTSPYYPQSNGKLERWHKSLKTECIRPGTPLSLDDARRLVVGYVAHYNTVRLHSAIDYVTPKDKLEGREKEIGEQRDRKLNEARERRRTARQAARASSVVETAQQAIRANAVAETARQSARASGVAESRGDQVQC
jgi:putative transposase